MDAKYYSLIEMGFTGAVVLGFSVWQLWTVRPSKVAPKDHSRETSKVPGNRP